MVSKSSVQRMAALCVATGAAMSAFAVVDGANVNLRIFNDAPGSNASFVNNYPASIQIRDENVKNPAGGFANRHNFRLSSGGVDAAFPNNEGFVFSSDVRIDGPGFCEGGLNIAPWWSQQVDGNFMLNSGSGEVAIFGGRLPFYSFTGQHGVHYTAGTTVNLGARYRPNGLSAGSPGTIEYFYNDGVNAYTSGVIPFDQGNPAEDPPHGLWGLLNDYMVGGYYMPYVDNFVADPTSQITFSNISYVPAPGAAAFLGLAGLAAGRRRR